MGLAPLDTGNWIEPDADLEYFQCHKQAQRKTLGDRVYHSNDSSLEAERELSAMLANYLATCHPDRYQLTDGEMHCQGSDVSTPIESVEPLWNCSLWLADDLLLMQERSGQYRLNAASLCCANDWALEDKIGAPMAEIHRPVPGLNESIGPNIDRFFARIQAEKPVYRCIWSLQVGNTLNHRPETIQPANHDSKLFYRSERQSLRRLPDTGALAFTIRTYIHPLETLLEIPGALSALLDTIDALTPALSAYKGLDEMQPALQRYRHMAVEADPAD